MLESEMEDLIAAYTDEFFPDRGWKLTGRQGSFLDVGRFDLMFHEDRHDTNILMELKAGTAKFDVADQLFRYKDELQSRGEKNILMWLVAPQIPSSVREFLDGIGIEYTEIHAAIFRQVADRHGFLFRDMVREAHVSAAAEARLKRVGNWVDWLSAGYESDRYGWKGQFERMALDRTWAYRPFQQPQIAM
jgi:hypothetical protein